MTLAIKCLPESSKFYKKQYGEYLQLEVIGWNRLPDNGRLYYIKCSICCKDPELFGDGIFTTSASALSRGSIPCGCAINPRWTKNQYLVKCERKAKFSGYIFKNFYGDWKGKSTKLEIVCQKHGEWYTATIDSFVNAGQGCPCCRTDKLRESRLKEDHTMIQSFFSSGQFSPNTLFWRSDRKDSENKAKYWYMYCPICECTAESLAYSLQSGHVPCDCSTSRQKQAYINILYNNDVPIAVKFGVSNNPKNRLKTQQSLSPLYVYQHIVMEFPSKQQCLKAERECKSSMQCGILSKDLMPDGYTETTYCHNLDQIIQIYEKNGGISI